MYVTEAMIQSMEEMMRNAADMEKHIKAMMETEARMHGLELDSRHNARDMWGQLNEHMANHAPAAPADPMMHTHDDGLTHSHPGGDEPHEHHDESSDLDNMTKRELEALGREHGIELDRRKNKQDLIEELSAHMNN